MPDVTLDVGVSDKGAARLIKDLVAALNGLKSANSAVSQGAAKAARENAAALKDQALIAQSLVHDRRRQVAEITAALKTQGDAEIAAARTAVQAARDQHAAAAAAVQDKKRELQAAQEVAAGEVAAARKIAAAQNEIAKGFQKAAEQRLRDARASAQTFVAPNGTRITTGPSQDAIKAREQELRLANENVARAQALGQVQIANARQGARAAAQAVQNAQAEAKAASLAVQAAQRQLTAARELARVQGTEGVKAAKQALTNAQAQLRAANQVAGLASKQARDLQVAANKTTGLLNQQANAANTSNRVLAQLRTTVLQLVAAYGGFRVLEGFIGTGLRFNQIMQTSQLGIASLITAESELHDEQGRLLTGTAALGAAQGLAAGQLQKLRVAGIQTAATTEELVTAFQEAVGAGLSVGLTLDQIRGFTVQVAQAASTINLPFNQLNQEVRSILQGTIDRNSRIAKALQLTNEQVRLAKEQGRLADLLNEKFQAFTLAGKESLNTFATLRSNIKDAVQVFAGASTKTLFDEITRAGQDALKQVFNFDTATIRESFKGIITSFSSIFGEVGKALADGIKSAVTAAETLSVWLTKHHDEVAATAAAVATTVREFGKLIAAVVATVTGVAKLGTETNAIIVFARLAAGFFQAVREHLAAIIIYFAGGAILRGIQQLEKAIAATVALRAAQASLGGLAGAVGFIPVVGGLLAGAIALSSAINAISKANHNAALEAARLKTELGDTKAAMVDESTAVAQMAFDLEHTKAKGQELTEQQKQLHDGIENLIRQHPEYNAVLLGTEGNYRAIIKAIQDYNLALADKALVELDDAEAQRKRLAAGFELQQKQTERGIALLKAQHDRSLGPAIAAQESVLQRQREEANDALEVQDTLVESLTQNYLKLGKAAFATTRVTITPPKAPGPTGNENAQLNDAVEKAKAHLQLVQAQAKAAEAQLNADEAAGLKTQQQLIMERADLQLAVAQAEKALHEAELNFARTMTTGTGKNRRVGDKGKEALAQAGIDETDAAIRIILAKRSEALHDAAVKDAKMQEDIEIRYLNASGKRLEAASREAAARRAAELQEAIDQFGAGSVQVLHLRIAIDHEQAVAQLDLLQQEITRIQQIAAARTEAIKTQFAGRKLTNADRQQLAELLADVNKVALTSAADIRNRLLDLRRALADDPEGLTFIDRMIAQLDALKAKTKEVDIELQKLQEGATEALTQGLATFFEDMGDASKSLGDAFHDMVASILRDLQRLTSQLLASKIVDAIKKIGSAASSAGGGSDLAGNAFQIGSSFLQGTGQGFAGGGAFQTRPTGRLRGPGTPTSDSITAQVSRDEFIIRERASRFWGYDFLEALNNMNLPGVARRLSRSQPLGRFAEGGAFSGTGRTSTIEGRLQVGLDRGLVMQEMRDFLGSSEGERIYIELDQRTRKRRGIR